MSGRKALVGLSLLCALVFCAFGAATASAANHTTAYTCDPAAVTKDFTEEHCDTKSGGVGSYGHTLIPAGTTTIVGTNNTTGSSNPSWILNGTIAGTAIEIECTTISAMSDIENNAAGEDVKAKGTFTSTGCKLLKPATQTENCTVTVTGEPATATTTGMGIKFTPETGSTFAKITLANAPGKTCKGVAGTFNVEGSVIGTGVGGEEAEPVYSGATLHFTDKMSTESLTFAGNPAGLTGTLTFKMAPNGSEPQNPIVFTTRP